MGYCFSVDDWEFRIPRCEQLAALKAARAIPGHLQWVGENISLCTTLAEVFDAFGWHEEYDDDNGDIVGIEFDREKIGDELKLWQAIAPFVDAGSYIQCHGEDGDVWRWVFDGTTCVEKQPKMGWD